MNWRVYTSHHTRHFSKRQRLPGDYFSPLIEDHAPKYIDFNSCDSALCRILTERRGGAAQANSYTNSVAFAHHSGYHYYYFVCNYVYNKIIVINYRKDRRIRTGECTSIFGIGSYPPKFSYEIPSKFHQRFPPIFVSRATKFPSFISLHYKISE